MTRIIENIQIFLACNQRHKRYETELRQAQIHRVSSPTLGTPIRSTETDYSHMFGGF